MLKIQRQNIFIVGSHLDDIEIGMGETLRELAKPKNKNNIVLVILSSGTYHDKRTNSERYQQRLKTFQNNFLDYSNLTTIIYGDAVDTEFFDHRLELRRFLEKVYKDEFPDGADVVFSQDSDLHIDHRITSELVDVIARPDTDVKMFFKFLIPGSAAFKELQYSMQSGFLLKGFNNWAPKKRLLTGYVDCGIISVEGNIRTLSGIKDTNKYWGSLSNSKYAEKFRVVFLKA